ncbi:hypothetical protein M1N51_02090 [Peptococcaceae bacterium]|nr:hypothetical protein [Peptococcaceae bacterium]
MTLMAIVVPCVAQIAMLVALFFGMDVVLGNYRVYAGEVDGCAHYFWLVLLTLVIIYIVGGLIMNKFVKRDQYEDEFLLEIPPYRRPHLRAVFKKLWVRIKSFITEAILRVLLIGF